MINVLQNRQFLIFPADLCRFVQGVIIYNIKLMSCPSPSAMSNAKEEKLDHCVCQTALDIWHSMNTSHKVKLVNRLPSSTTLVCQLIPCCLFGTGQETLDSYSCQLFPTQWMPVMSARHQQFNLSFHINQFFLTCGSGKTELLSVHPEP